MADILSQIANRVVSVERLQNKHTNDFRLQTGWIPFSETWSYASPTTFTVPADVQDYFPIGTKIKLTQTAVGSSSPSVSPSTSPSISRSSSVSPSVSRSNSPSASISPSISFSVSPSLSPSASSSNSVSPSPSPSPEFLLDDIIISWEEISPTSSPKYFYVVGSSYVAPNTTVTITAGSLYILTNEVITDQFYSYMSTPQGFPQWFTYDPLWTGSVANPVIGNGALIGAFTICDGGVCKIKISITMGSTTTYGTGTWLLSLPVQARNDEHNNLGLAVMKDDNTGNVYPRIVYVAPNLSYVNSFRQLDSPNTTILTIDATTPFTWNTGDLIYINAEYAI